jgi:amino-acid N-acetyltransferase
MRIEPATDADLSAVTDLLRDAGLPLVGVVAAFRTGVVARVGDTLVGAAAMEPYGEVALLRSVVVRPSEQGGGTGRKLVSAVEDLARAGGVRETYLMTETAEAWFAAQGYAVLDRSELPPTILATDEVAVACGASAVAMRRTL